MPGKRVRKKWRLNEKRLGRDEKTCFSSCVPVCSRPNPSRRARPNRVQCTPFEYYFARETREKRTTSSLCLKGRERRGTVNDSK